MDHTFKLPPRLAAIAALVPDGARLADVGTDHALLPIRLLLDGKIQSAVATDIRPVRSPVRRKMPMPPACRTFPASSATADRHLAGQCRYGRDRRYGRREYRGDPSRRAVGVPEYPLHSAADVEAGGASRRAAVARPYDPRRAACA